MLPALNILNAMFAVSYYKLSTIYPTKYYKLNAYGLYLVALGISLGSIFTIKYLNAEINLAYNKLLSTPPYYYY